MRVQIFEQFHGGHYTNFIKHLLPTFIKLLNQKLISDIFVTITPEHFESKIFESELSQFSDRVKFIPSLQGIEQNLSLNPKLVYQNPSQIKISMQRRGTILRNLHESISEIKPDYLISTTADSQSMLLAMQAALGRDTLPKNIYSLGLTHYGYSGFANNFIDHCKNYAYQLTWKNSPWTRLLFVNPLIYESIKSRGMSFKNRIALVPNPLQSSTYLDKKTARKLLNIPEDGRYIGFVGGMDHRKAILEVVSAFRAANLAPTDRLLLAGKMLPEYKRIIEENFKELLELRRIIILDRYLESTEIVAGYCALDVPTILYYSQPTLSANLLDAIALKKPVIANKKGYTGMIIDRFNVGWSCDPTDHQQLVAILQKGLDKSADYSVNEMTERLIQFHQPENYAKTVLADFLKKADPTQAAGIKTWEWVNELRSDD